MGEKGWPVWESVVDRVGGVGVAEGDSRDAEWRRARDFASSVERAKKSVAWLVLAIEVVVARRLVSRWKLRAVLRWADLQEGRVGAPPRRERKRRASPQAYVGVIVVVLGAAAQTPNQQDPRFALETGNAALVSGVASLVGVLLVLLARRRGDLVGMGLFFVVVAGVMTVSRGAYDDVLLTVSVLFGLALQVATMVVGVRGMRGAGKPVRGGREQLDEAILERTRAALAERSPAERAATRGPAVEAVRVLYERRQVEAAEAEWVLRELLRGEDSGAGI